MSGFDVNRSDKDQISVLYLSGFLIGICEPMHTCVEQFTMLKFKGLFAQGIPGLILFITGLTIFFKFLNKYPKAAEELKNA